MFRWLHGRGSTNDRRTSITSPAPSKNEHTGRLTVEAADAGSTKDATGEPRRVHYVFRGEVQGVGFRWNAQRCANNLNLSGWVRNEWDGSVTMEIQGGSEAIARFFADFNKHYSRYHITYVIDEKEDIALRDDESSFRVLYT